MSEFRGPNHDADDPGTGVSYSTWQDRQLAVILERTNQLLRELREAHAALSGRNESLSRELGRATALLEICEAELRQRTERETALDSDMRYWRARASALGDQLQRQAENQTDPSAGQPNPGDAARFAALKKNYTEEIRALTSKANGAALE